jgi:N-acetylglutamate synthase-like GNAT family acetyltransferase
LIGVVQVRPAANTSLALELARVINEAYAVSEGDLFRDDAARTSRAEVEERIGAGAMLVANENGRVVGCASLRPIDDATTELGFVSATPDSWGSGIGSELVRGAEDLARSRGNTTMQLKLLVPSNGAHPQKDRLAAWYRRLGYEKVGALAFEEVSSRPASELAVPCEFHVYRKPLTASTP